MYVQIRNSSVRQVRVQNCVIGYEKKGDDRNFYERVCFSGKLVSESVLSKTFDYTQNQKSVLTNNVTFVLCSAVTVALSN